MYDQDPIFLVNGEAAIWANGCWAWPNLEEAGAAASIITTRKGALRVMSQKEEIKQLKNTYKRI